MKSHDFISTIKPTSSIGINNKLMKLVGFVMVLPGQINEKGSLNKFINKK
jgi:hypothetical protein